MVVAIRAADAQVPQFGSPAATPIQGGVGSAGGPPIDIPRTNLTPIAPAPPFGTAGTSSAPVQLADPYAVAPNSGVFGAPPAAPPGQSASLFGRIFSSPTAAPITPGYGTQLPSGVAPPYGQVPAAPSGFSQPGFVQPGYPQPGVAQPGFGPEAVYGTNTYAAPGAYGQQTFPGSVYPSSTPQTLFPDGVFSSNGFMTSESGVTATAFRLFQGPRFQYSYLYAGDEPPDLAVNNMDVSLVFAVPRFCYSQQPLFIIPSFSLQLWDGPDGSTGADLPPNAYSAFIDTGWESDPNQIFGTDLGVRVGVFTDWNTFNSDSIRILGRGLVNFRLSPTSTLKGGVYYLDRNTIKLVPALGILYTPNPYSRYDIFFPQPKLARYFRTVGTRDVWGYLAGDYGGGNWTIERTSGESDSVDLNEYRVVAGLEWGLNDAIRAGRRSGFFEIGYAFNRSIGYRYNPQDDIDTNSSVVFRAGFGY